MYYVQAKIRHFLCNMLVDFKLPISSKEILSSLYKYLIQKVSSQWAEAVAEQLGHLGTLYLGQGETGVLPHQMFILIFCDLRFPISLALVSYSTHILQYYCSAYSLFYTARAFGICVAINATEI